MRVSFAIFSKSRVAASPPLALRVVVLGFVFDVATRGFLFGDALVAVALRLDLVGVSESSPPSSAEWSSSRSSPPVSVADWSWSVPRFPSGSFASPRLRFLDASGSGGWLVIKERLVWRLTNGDRLELFLLPG